MMSNLTVAQEGSFQELTQTEGPAKTFIEEFVKAPNNNHPQVEKDLYDEKKSASVIEEEEREDEDTKRRNVPFGTYYHYL
jgi:hypothetical protein